VAQVPLDPSVIKVSPGFADALTKSNLPPSQRNMVEQMSMTYVKAKKLLKMSEEKARKEFLDLDPIVKENIRYIYPTQKRFEAEQNLLGKATQFVTGQISAGVKTFFSPVLAGFGAAEIAGKVANTAGNVYQQTAYQNKPFTKKVLTDAYNGKNQWRWDDVTAYEKKYGKALVTLARGSLEFKTPGESIDMYGNGIDEDMLAALKLQANEPNKFAKLLEEIKQGAQLSPGRNLAQIQTNVGGNPNSWAVKVAKKLGFDTTTTEGQVKASKFISGPVDAIYQILNPADPLNWIGVGPIIKTATKGIDGIKVSPVEALQFGGFRNRGERLAQQYEFIAQRGGDMGIKEATRFVFQQPDVVKLWDDELGPIVKRYADATTKAEKGLVYRAIREEFPEWANESVVRELADAGAFNAPAAQKFFQMGENGRYLLNLRVDGTDFYRNGIPVARRTRKLAAVMQQDINKRLFGELTGDDIKTLDMSAKEAVEKLKLTAAEDDSLLSPLIDEVNRLNKDMDTTIARARRMASRSPGRILYGPDAIKTINEVRDLLHVVGFPRHFADVMAEHFVDESIEYQITMIRNLYAGFYKKIGMNGQTGGDTHMAELLNSTFNEKAGMTSLGRIEIPQGWEVDLPRSIYKYDNDVPILTSRGGIHPGQIAEGIAPINFDMAFEYAAMDKLSDKVNFMKNLGGVTRNIAVRKITNFWSNFTLFPRHGVRSSIDEAVFGSMVMPLEDLMKLATAPINSTGAQIRAATAITGSSAGIGMYKRGVYKMFPHLDPRKKIPAEARRKILEDLAGDGPVGNVLHGEIMNSTVDRAISFYGDTLPKETWESLRLIMKHNPHMIDSMAQSLGAKASMSGKVDVDYIDSMFTGNAWDRFFQEMGLKKSKIYTPRELSKLKEKERVMAFYDNWMLRFGFNGQKVAPGVYINPTPFFFANNGLRESKDFNNARRAMLEQLGIRYDNATGLLVPRVNDELATKFISPYGMTALYRQQGQSNIDIADAIIVNMLMDMKTTFHGSTNGFNDTLFNLISKKRSEILREAEAKNQTPFDTWSKAIEVTDFKEFEEATLGMIPSSGIVNTRLVNIADGEFDAKSFEEFEGIDGFLERFQGWAMDVMDAQVTGLYRQKMLWITVDRNLRELKPFQANIAKDHFDNLMATTPNRGPLFEKRAKAQAEELAEKQVVELAWNDSVNTLLKYVDNPSVRSNLAISVRSVARFYRATEDFYRRVWRLYTKAPLRTLYRMRLIHQGLEAHGEVYTDDKGDDYIIFPTDGIINNVIEPVIRMGTGNSNFQIPQFNDLTLKLRLINPSFSPDAGQPTLSGPVAAVSMIAMKNLLRDLPLVPSSIKESIKPATSAAADSIDTILLGNIGASLDLQRAITPMFFQGIWNTLSPSERDRQKVSAGLQAISYLEAFGNGAPRQKDYIGREDEYARAMSKYLKNLRIAANTIVGFRNIFSNVSPGQPSLRETASLPDYIKQVGLMSPNAQFWDIYNGIINTEGANSSNAWDLAVATFVGQNPGKMAFLAPRNNKEYSIFINKTDNIKNWSVKNSRFVEDYKEAAWLFAPKAGEYNPDVYGWMTATGLITIPEFEDYLEQVQLEVDKDIYFKIKDNETEKLKTTNDTTLRKLIVAESQRDRTALLTANPLLAADIEGKLQGKGSLTNRFFNLTGAVRDPKAPISKQLRTTFMFAINEVNAFIAFANDNDNKDSYDYSGMKAAEKARVQAVIDELSESVPEIREANRLILTPLLNSYSRDTISAGPKEGN
jgi:hypothetical protein